MKLLAWPVCCLIVVGLLAAPAIAVDIIPERLAQATPGISKDEAAALARQATDGRVLDVQAEERHGEPTYRVKLLLSDGRVRVLWVDARTGQLLDSD